MTLPAQTGTNSSSSTSNGVTTVFPYDFRIFDAADLVVKSTLAGLTTTLTLTTHYTVQNIGELTGTYTLTPAGLEIAATTSTISPMRLSALTQATDLQNQGAFFAEVIEQQMDRLVSYDQDLRRVVDGLGQAEITALVAAAENSAASASASQTSATASQTSASASASAAAASAAASSNASNLTSGTVADARLPARLGVRPKFWLSSTDSFSVVETGWHILPAGSLNTPDNTRWWLVEVAAPDLGPIYNVRQTFHDFLNITPTYSGVYTRFCIYNAWQSFQYEARSRVEQDARFEPKRTRFISGQYAFTPGTQLNIPHGLGAEPFDYTMYLQCVTADAGYTAGYKIPISSLGVTNASQGFDTFADATYVTLRTISATYYRVNAGLTIQALTPSSWRVVANGNL
jgi:hypothetical protein